MVRRLTLLVLTAAMVLLPGPAQAATRTVTDEYNGSTPGLNVLQGTFSHREDAVVVRVRFEELRPSETMLVLKYFRRDDVTIQVATKYRTDGTLRVIVHRLDSDSFRRLSADRVDVRWNFADDVIWIRIGQDLMFGRSAGFLAWSQPKRAQHGSPGGRDELYVARLRRG